VNTRIGSLYTKAELESEEPLAPAERPTDPRQVSLLPRTVLGVDAGKRSGVALVDVGVRDCRILTRGVYEQAELGPRVKSILDAGVDLVVIEVPDGTNYGKKPNTAALLNARGVGERLAGFCEALGHRVLLCTALEVRGALRCRPKKGETGDAAVKRMIRTRVSNWPNVSADHERDAAAAAIFGALKVGL
jgi:hypothetical protein